MTHDDFIGENYEWLEKLSGLLTAKDGSRGYQKRVHLARDIFYAIPIKQVIKIGKATTLAKSISNQVWKKYNEMENFNG